MPRRRLTAALALAALAASAALAPAQSGGPAPLAPSNGKTLKRGVAFTFKVKAPGAGKDSVFLKVARSKRKGRDGTLAGDEYFRKMGKSGSTFSKKTDRYPALSDYFLNRRGTYYWQAYTIDCAAQTDCNVEGRIRSFRIR